MKHHDRCRDCGKIDAFIRQRTFALRKRKLAYRVDKYHEGIYVLMQFSAGPDTVKELERRLRVADLVIKFLTVRIDHTLKRLEKRKKQRDKRAHRRASVVASTPAVPSVAQQMLGEAPVEKES